MNMNQTYTLKKYICLQGLGIHTGRTVKLTIKPSDTDGLVFVRTDLNHALVPVNPQNMIPSSRATILQNGAARIVTPEHLLAALWMTGITRAVIELDQEEIPIMDGSSRPFAEAILEAGRRTLTAPLSPVVVTQPLFVAGEDRSLTALPAENFQITYILDYPNTFIGSQVLSLELNERVFIDEIASARTYGFYSEIKSLLDKGLAQGGSLENAVVIGADNYMNPLRFQNELVRHKILDLIGDLATLNRPIQGHFVAIKSGHDENRQMVQKLARHA